MSTPRRPQGQPRGARPALKRSFSNAFRNVPDVKDKHDRFCSYCKSVIESQVLTKAGVCMTCFMPVSLRFGRDSEVGTYRRCPVCDCIVKESSPFCYMCSHGLLHNSEDQRKHRMANAGAMETLYKRKMANSTTPPPPAPRAPVKTTEVKIYPPKANDLSNKDEDAMLMEISLEDVPE